MPQIPDHLYRILIIGGSESGKTNSLFGLIKHQSDNDKVYLYVKYLYEDFNEQMRKCRIKSF